jgi:hypothetical protein
MSAFWRDDLSMEDECREIVQWIGQSASSNSSTRTAGGRVWASCVSCPRLVVLVNQSWLAKKHAGVLGERNGYVSTVCGICERKDGRMLSEGQVGGIRIRRETIESSLPYRAIASHCSSNGWDDLVVKSERVLDRRALLQPHLPSLTVRSVTVEEDGEEWRVKVSDYVEVAFI